MTDESTLEALDRSIAGVVLQGEFASTGDEDVDALARLATGLRGLAAPAFKAGLREELVPQAGWRPLPWSDASSVRSLTKGQGPYFAAGSSCGLVAGACCISGFTAHVLGLAGAAAVTTFIHSTLPYFIALSIVGMLGWILWVLREQGITPSTLGNTLSRHGLALGTSYAVVFANSMALTMSTGLL